MAAVKIRLPSPWKSKNLTPGQYELFHWDRLYPDARVLIAPCGTKVGKSFGCALWLSKEALLNKNCYMVWISPTYAKCKIGYRYMKAMLNIDGVAKCIDGLLEIRMANGTIIKFLHGRDAEVTVEGEAIDRFVIDETGKIDMQVWFSLLTTITQTGGIGIVTGTPRGFTWYYELYKKALDGDPFFCCISIRTIDSPYVKDAAVEKAKNLLPKHLFDQYYLAIFTSAGTIFGDLTDMWDESLGSPSGVVKFWIHPDESKRTGDIFHGVDIAKKRDYTVFYSVNSKGETVGFCRFTNTPYPTQAKRFELYLKKYFSNAEDNLVQFDETGVGTALGDLFTDLDIDASFTAVTFTNKSKANMVMKLTLAVEQKWLTAPRIPVIESELSSYEVQVTRTGLHSYNAASGSHDDIVCAMMLAVATAYQNSLSEQAEILMDELGGSKNSSSDGIIDFVQTAFPDSIDDYFETDEKEEADEEFLF